MIKYLLSACFVMSALSFPAAAENMLVLPSGCGTASYAPGMQPGTVNTAGQGCVVASVTTNYDKRVTSVPTVQNAAYSSTNCIGGFNAVTLSTGTGVAGLLQTTKVVSVAGNASPPTITVYLFDSNPSGSTCTDKSTFTLAAADVSKVIGAPFALSLTAPTGTSTLFAAQTNMAMPFVEGGSSSSGVSTIYYALVSGSTFTPASTTDIQVSIGASMDAN